MAIARRALTYLLLAFMATSLLACENLQQSKQPQTVRIGVLFPMTGSLADKGQDSLEGITLAVEEINASGGIKSLGGVQLEVVSADSKGDPDIGQHETQRLITEQNVAAMIGTYQSSVAKTATQAAEQYRTPFIVNMAIADVITERGFKYTFRICPKASYYGRDQVTFLNDLSILAGYPVKRVALIHENTDFGTSAALAQKEALRANNMSLVAEISYAADRVTDLNSEVAALTAEKPDAILEVTYLNDAILIRQALVQTHAGIPLIDTAGGTVSPAYIGRLGPMAEGTFTVSEFSKYAEGGDVLNSRFRARFGTDITGDSAYAYQAVWVLKDALERAGSQDRDRIRQALAATDMPRGDHMILPAERLHFNTEGQNEFAPLYMVQIQQGQWMPVWPSRYAVAKVVLNQ